MIDHNKLSGIIMEILTDDIHGKITEIIAEGELKATFHDIEMGLEPEKKLPNNLENENIYNILKIMSMKSSVISNRIIIELKIPIISDNIYTIYKSVPFQQKSVVKS